MFGYQIRYAAAFALAQLKVAGCSFMVVAKHRVLGCLIRADDSKSHNSLNPPSQFLRGAAVGVSCSEGLQFAALNPKGPSQPQRKLGGRSERQESPQTDV